MNRKTRKHHIKNKHNYLETQHNNAKKGTHLKCRLKTCRSKKYQAVYGATKGGSARENRQFFY